MFSYVRWCVGLGADPVLTANAKRLMPTVKLTRRLIDGTEPTEARIRLFDSEMPGFGAIIHPSGRRMWIVSFRPGVGGRNAPMRQLNLGPASGPGALTLEEARRAARNVLADARRGDDPATKRAKERADKAASLTFNQLADDFMAASHPKLKVRSVEFYRAILRSDALREFGKTRALAIKRTDVRRLHTSLAEGGLLSASAINARVRTIAAVYKWAKQTGRIDEDHVSPSKGVELLRERRIERFLNDDELGRLGLALKEIEAYGVARRDPTKKHSPKTPVHVDPGAIAAIRILVLTGMRLRELLNLQWQDVDVQRGILNLKDSKSGPKAIVLNGAALSLIAALPRLADYVIPGQKVDKPRSGLDRPWLIVRQAAGLPNMRLHDLRHAYASTAAGAGVGLRVVGQLLGHRDSRTTERYAHVADTAARRATELVGARLSEAMAGAPAAGIGRVVQIRSPK